MIQEVIMATTMITRQHIATTLQTLMEDTSFSRITVANLCEACYVSRKTFYYHFRDKFDLLAWIFQQECGNVMTQEHYNGFWDFYSSLADYLVGKRPFYRNVFSSEGRVFFLRVLRSYMREMFPKFMDTLTLPVGSTAQCGDCIDFLCTTFAASLEEWICHRPYLTTADYVSLSRFDKIPS